jgi:hypothetical protein
VRGGLELADEDAGYSSIRALTASEVFALHQFLSGLSHDTLRQRFDLSAMTALNIYAKARKGVASRTEDEIEHLLRAFDDLRAFMARRRRTAKAQLCI